MLYSWLTVMSLCVFVVLFETGTVLLKLYEIYEVLTFLDEGIVLIEQPVFEGHTQIIKEGGLMVSLLL